MRQFLLLCLIFFSISSCAKKTVNIDEEVDEEIEQISQPLNTIINENSHPMEGTFILNQDNQAVVTAVNFSGSEENYIFNVELTSPDTGCDQYADWWEIFNKEGQLIYRRILTHSHVNEQPFTRGGGLVEIKEDTFVYIRGHMNNLGYGSLVYGGTVKDGFEAIELPIEFAAELAELEPLPTSCAF